MIFNQFLSFFNADLIKFRPVSEFFIIFLQQNEFLYQIIEEISENSSNHFKIALNYFKIVQKYQKYN